MTMSIMVSLILTTYYISLSVCGTSFASNAIAKDELQSIGDEYEMRRNKEFYNGPEHYKFSDIVLRQCSCC